MKLLFPVIILFVMLSGCQLRKEITATRIKVSPLYTDHMVIRKKNDIRFSGHSSPNALLAVQIGDILKYGKSNNNGDWMITFPDFDRPGPFNIKIIGKDSTITLHDVTFGHIELLAGRFKDDRLLIKKDTGHSKIRIYKFPVSLKKNPRHDIPRGKWIATGLHFSDIYDLIGDSSRYNSVPFVGFIVANENLSGLAAWIDRDLLEKTDSLLTDTSYRYYDTINYDSLYKNELSILHIKDSLIHHSNNAIGRGILTRTYDDELWWFLTLPAANGIKQIGRRNGIKWMRKKVYIPSKYIEGNFYAKIGRLPKLHNVYFNETDITSSKSGDSVFVIPDSLVKIWTNILTVRLVSDQSEVYIRGDAEDFYIYNPNTQFKSALTGEWKLSERQEPDLPEVTEVWSFPGVYFNAVVYPFRNVEIDGFYWVDKQHPAHEKNTGVLTSFLIESWSQTFNWKNLNTKKEGVQKVFSSH